MILVYSNPTKWEHPLFFHQEKAASPEERDAQLAGMTRLMEEISASGELGPTHVLGDPALTKTVRPQEDSLVTTDGPFLESKEHLAGWFVVDVPSLDRAIEIASRIPDTRYLATEVRPILDVPRPD
ncbi:YciI family protein [Amycolatopsis sp. CA-230715]|uniref:YciI family protein n=1 Tax=Amycolatopsis sp. CA-230715 TaxID=2745196 RepID=UPI0020B36645|nr:YciI family protein [Amycolatopsis sp. CA-230715]